jgi:hypothetical protein
MTSENILKRRKILNSKIVPAILSTKNLTSKNFSEKVRKFLTSQCFQKSWENFQRFDWLAN